MLKALQDLVSRLAGNPELPAQRGHALPVFEPNHKAHPFVHNRTFLPWHPLLGPSFGPKSVTHVSGTFCYLCLRPDTSIYIQFWNAQEVSTLQSQRTFPWEPIRPARV